MDGIHVIVPDCHHAWQTDDRCRWCDRKRYASDAERKSVEKVQRLLKKAIRIRHHRVGGKG